MLPTTDNYLLHCSSKTDAIQASQQTNFETLDVRLQGFIKLVGQGETRMAALLSQETTNVKDHITFKADELGQSLGQISRDNQRAYQEISQATVEVGANVTILARRTDDKTDQDRKQARHDRLLKSLKYATMNERRNQIHHPHTETFQWIFGDAPTSGDAPASEDSFVYDMEEDFLVDDSTYEDASIPKGRLDRVGRDCQEIREAAAGFIEWARDPSSQLFWISGKPGSGKSTLMKFLAESPRTLELLDSASPAESRTVVLSHFIWSAGQPIEATVKGLLCSLLYQVLSEQSACEAVLEKHPGTRTKDSVFDWSEDELQGVLFEVLSALGRPLCLFIDGLDEISSPAGQFQVLDMINGLRLVPAVKTCVSSRPEAVFQQCLSQYPMFRVQDLTMFDIERFAAHTLKTAFEGSQVDFGEDNLKYNGQLLRHICVVADGVFLWVALAVRSLKAGLVKGDGPKELDQRLHALPSDLTTLYNSMWDRLGDEKAIYQRDAARYINLLRTDSVQPLLLSDLHERKNSLIVILLAYDRSLSQKILKGYNDSRHPISRDTLSHHLNRQRIGLEARCAGLVEVRNGPFAYVLSKLEAPHRDRRLDWYDDRLYFIHRSAQDFILNQSGPERLLDKDDSTGDMRLNSLALAHLAACCLEDELLSQRWWTDLPLVIDLVSRILRNPSDGTSSVPHELVTECGRLIGRTFRCSRKPRWQPCRHSNFGAILSWCLPIELLKTAFLSIPPSVYGKYTAYLFIGAICRIGFGLPVNLFNLPTRLPMEPRDEVRLSPEVYWLCEIAKVVDLGFQRVVCWEPLGPHEKTKDRCHFKFNAPHTPLSVTVQCLQTWTWRYWELMGETGFMTRNRLGVCFLNILRSLLTRQTKDTYMSYPTIIAIRTPAVPARFLASNIIAIRTPLSPVVPAGFLASNPPFIWESVTKIEALKEAEVSTPENWIPAVLVKTNMRLAVGLLAADMRRWGQEDLCGLLLHHLGRGASFDIKVTEVLMRRAKKDLDPTSPWWADRFGLRERVVTTTTPRSLVRIEHIFNNYLNSALAENAPSREGTCGLGKDLLQELLGLVKDIQDSDDGEYTVEKNWWHIRKRWVQDGTFWRTRDDVRAQPPERDVLGEIYSSWVEASDSEEADSEIGYRESEESDWEERGCEESNWEEDGSGEDESEEDESKEGGSDAGGSEEGGLNGK